MPQALFGQRAAMHNSRNNATAEVLIISLQVYPAPVGRSTGFEAQIFGPGRLRYTSTVGKNKVPVTRHFVLQESFIKNVAVALQKAKFLAFPDSLPISDNAQKIRLTAFSQGKRKTIVFPRHANNIELRKLFEEMEANIQSIVQEQEPMADTLDY